MKSDLEKEALKYEYGSGAERLALLQGKKGVNFKPDKLTINPYRLGLNMKLRECELTSIVAEDFVRGVLPEQIELQNGFFEEARAIRNIIDGKGDNQPSLKGPNGFEHSYLNGALICVDAYIANVENVPATTNVLRVLGELRRHRNLLCRKLEEVCFRLEFYPGTFEILRAAKEAAEFGNVEGAKNWMDIYRITIPRIPSTFLNETYENF